MDARQNHCLQQYFISVLKWKDTNQAEGTFFLKVDTLQLCIVGAHAMTPAGCILFMLPLLPNTSFSLGKV